MSHVSISQGEIWVGSVCLVVVGRMALVRKSFITSVPGKERVPV